VAEYDDQIEAAGAGIIWVLEANSRSQPGTAQSCYDTIRGFGADRGVCVGDGETAPVARAFDNSPFAIGRGFDLIVPRDTMVIEYISTHGTPSGNENADGQEILDAVKGFTGR
jgi:hypothetical protein